MTTLPLETLDLELWRDNPTAFLENLTLPAPTGDVRFGDVMAKFQRERFEMLAPSLRAVAVGGMPDARRFWFEGSKGCSKDSDVAACLLWLLIFSPRPLQIQVGAVDRDQARELRRAASSWLAANPWMTGFVEASQWKISNPNTGSEMEIIAADAAGSHGSRPDVFVGNEVGHHAKPDFLLTGLDNMSKVPNSVAVMMTNPGFIGGWQWDLREMARTSEDWQFHVVDRPAPWISDQDIEDAKQRNPPQRFARLWMGQWTAESGDAISAKDIAACTVLEGPQPYDDSLIYVAGLDIGIRRDHSALVVLCADPGKQVVRLQEVRWWDPREYSGEVPIERVVAAIHEVRHKYGIEHLCADPREFYAEAQRLREHVATQLVHFVPKVRHTMAQTLLDGFRDRWLELFPCDELERDLLSLQVRETGQYFGLVAPRDAGGHADRAIALSIALPAAREYSLYSVKQWGEDLQYDHETGTWFTPC